MKLEPEVKKNVFRMPTPVKITGRTSSMTNAFVNGIIPVIEPTDEEIDDVLATLGMTRESICCAYCGDTYTEWDHFHPLIKDKEPTGYISEIRNLVPACGKCNQSKGNKEWETWMRSDAKLSPKSRNVKDLENRIEKLRQFEQKFSARKYDLKALAGAELWEKHQENRKKLFELMRECQKTSDEVKAQIDANIKRSKG